MKQKTKRRLLRGLMPFAIIWVIIALTIAGIGLLTLSLAYLMLGDRSASKAQIDEILSLWRND
ncbi:MAG: hypothetical protein J1E97_07925 [Muribaculaceae bacterium]|nr:hypothetical protein [Muribaculaceae bacterium]